MSGLSTIVTVDDLLALYASAEADTLYDEVVTERQHAEQCAARARFEGAEDALVAAALFHDVGHIVLRDNRPLGVDLERDHRHELAGATLLSRWFGPVVTEPVRLHVAAKRYLCTVEPAYIDRLTASSVRSLTAQGGIMTAADAERFATSEFAASAIALRRWDDSGKVEGLVVTPVADYRAMLLGLENT